MKNVYVEIVVGHASYDLLGPRYIESAKRLRPVSLASELISSTLMGLRKIDTVEEVVDLTETFASAAIAILPGVLSIAEVSKTALSFLSQAAGVLLAVKIADMIWGIVDIRLKVRRFSKAEIPERYDMQTEYAERLATKLDYMGDEPLPPKLRKELVDFFETEIDQSEEYGRFAKNVEKMEEHLIEHPRYRNRRKKEVEENLTKVLESIKPS